MTHLTRTESVPILIKAFENKELQCFSEAPQIPSYAGPCSIGILLPEEIRTQIAIRYPDHTIWHLNAKKIVTVDDVDWFWIMQQLHDALVQNKTMDKLGLLKYIKAKKVETVIYRKYR